MSSDENIFPEIGDIVNEKYQVTSIIGAESFGAIYEVNSIEDGNVYAIKLEKHQTSSPKLQLEHKIYVLLDAPVGVPYVYEIWNDIKYRGMAMDRLGSSLGHHSRKCGKILSLKTVCMCGIQMLCRLEYLHQRSFIHCDIKTDNFVFGYGKDSGLLNVIDLDLANRYRDLTTHVHINYAEDKGIAGTARYVSINVHLGV
jgi:serine/threonine protein kinase